MSHRSLFMTSLALLAGLVLCGCEAVGPQRLTDEPPASDARRGSPPPHGPREPRAAMTGDQIVSLNPDVPGDSAYAKLLKHVTDDALIKNAILIALPCSSRGAIDSVDKTCGGAGKTNSGKSFAYVRYKSGTLGIIDIVYGDIHPSSGATSPIAGTATAPMNFTSPTSFPGIASIDGGFAWIRVTPSPDPAPVGVGGILVGQRWRTVGTRTITGGARCGIAVVGTIPPPTGQIIPVLDHVYIVNPVPGDLVTVNHVTQCTGDVDFGLSESYYKVLANLSLNGPIAVASGSQECKFLGDVTAIVNDVFLGNTNRGLGILPNQQKLPPPPPTFCNPAQTPVGDAIKPDR